MHDLTELKRQRFSFLSKIYNDSNGDLNGIFDYNEVGVELSIDPFKAENIVDYLVNEGLLKRFGIGGLIGLTHLGLKEIEQAYENPNVSTEHFAPIVNNHITITSSGTGSVINTGNHNNVTINNTFYKNEIESKAEEILKVVTFDETISTTVKEEVMFVFKELISELQDNKPSSKIMDKVMFYGASISSIGSLVVGILQLLSSSN